MNDPHDRNLQMLLRSCPKPRMPADLRAAIEAETIYKAQWWESDLFRRRWLPAMIGAAAATAAWFCLQGHAQTPKPGLREPLPIAQGPLQRHPAIALLSVDESTRPDVLQ